jgi:hypothetical protein
MAYSRIKIRMPTTADELHIPAINETTRQVKICIRMLFEYDGGKGSKLLSTLDLIYTTLYIWSARVGEETSITQGSWTKFSSSTSNSSDLISE